MHEPLDDRELAARLVAGDERAFEACFERCYPAVFRFVLRRLGEAGAAEEIAQAALCQGLRRIATYRGEAALTTWFCVLARHELGAVLRRRGRAAWVALDADEPDSQVARRRLDAQAAQQQAAGERAAGLAQRVHAVLDRLPGRYGDALEWKYVQGLSVQAIAERLGLGPKAAESLLTRARRAFREAFGADEVGGRGRS